jgi:hypothetical protein
MKDHWGQSIPRAAAWMLAATSLASAQPQRATGWHRDRPKDVAARTSLTRARPVNLPARVDLRDKMPPVGDQGMQDCCVAWAAGYAMASTFIAAQQGWTLTAGRGELDAGHVMSPAFIYNSLNGGTDSGLALLRVLEFLEVTGTVPWKDMPYNESDFQTKPSAELVRIAADYRVVLDPAPTYARVWDKEAGLMDPAAVKLALSQGTPVIIGLLTNASFMENRGAIWSDRRGLAQPDEQADHAACLVGYDEHRGPHGAFLLMNSWGTEWGERGYGWIDGSLFAEAVFVGYTPTRLPAPGSGPPPPRPGFLEMPGQNPAWVSANWQRIEVGTALAAVLKQVGGPDPAMAPLNPLTGEPDQVWRFSGDDGLAVIVGWDERGRVRTRDASHPAK